jgi:hypothetical protein
VLEVEALAGLNDKACEKLIAQDKLKTEKAKDALEESHWKEVEKKKLNLPPSQTLQIQFLIYYVL